LAVRILFVRTVAVGLDFNIAYFKVNSSTLSHVENKAFDIFYMRAHFSEEFTVHIVQNPLSSGA